MPGKGVFYVYKDQNAGLAYSRSGSRVPTLPTAGDPAADSSEPNHGSGNGAAGGPRLVRRVRLQARLVVKGNIHNEIGSITFGVSVSAAFLDGIANGSDTITATTKDSCLNKLNPLDL